MKRILLNLNYKNSLIAFRFVGFLLLLFFLIYKPEIENEFAHIPWAPLIIYFCSNLSLFFIDEKYLQKTLSQFALFIFDIWIISWLIYISQGWSSDLYLIYFLVIFMSGIQMHIWQSFVIGTLACIVYGFFAFKTLPDLKFTTHVLLRFPFFYLVSFYTGFLAHYAKEMKAQLEKSYQEQIAHEEQRALLGRLAGRIAAEMTNPLSVTIGFAQGILKRVAESHEFYIPLSSILRESNRCVRLIENLLLLSDEMNPRIELIDMNVLIRNLLAELSLPSAHISIELLLDSALPSLKGDRKQIFRAVENILENSVEAMPVGGKITVQTRYHAEPFARHSERSEESRSWDQDRLREAVPSTIDQESRDSSALPQNDVIEIIIADTGNGIAEEYKNRIFEPFFSTKKEKAAGLGLSIASAIIQRYQGQISFESRVGEGTRFVLEFVSNELKQEGH